MKTLKDFFNQYAVYVENRPHLIRLKAAALSGSTERYEFNFLVRVMTHQVSGGNDNVIPFSQLDTEVVAAAHELLVEKYGADKVPPCPATAVANFGKKNTPN